VFLLSLVFVFIRSQQQKVLFERKLNVRLESKVIERTQELNSSNEYLEKANNQLEELSLTDQLTGLKNRRFLLNNLNNDLPLILRKYHDNELEKDSDCIFFMVDLDHFKQVNDIYGHTAGDAVLIQIKSILEGVFRETDYLVRWGGEEFLVIARFSNRENAPNLAEKLRCCFENHNFDIGNDNTLNKTCSIGFACFPFLLDKPNNLSWERIVDIADHCLYAAKKSSRNAWIGLNNINCSEDNLFENVSNKTKSLIDAKQLRLCTSIKNTDDINWS
jgi:diguanylate cyclase (GGDEF)-like protein